MLWILSVAVSLLWVLGTATAVTFGGLLHVLFATTILCVLLFLVPGRRVVPAVIRLREEEKESGSGTPGRHPR